MPALFFPTADVLRRALAGGLVPPGVARASARGRADGVAVWVEPAAPLPRPVLDALARLGVRERPVGDAPLEAVRSWAELLPLRPSSATPAGPWLVELPAVRLAAAVRAARRTAGAVGAALVPDEASSRAWLVTSTRPADDESEAEGLTEAAPGVWVRAGWEHPLPHLLAPPAGGCLLVRPPRHVNGYPVPPPITGDEVFPISGRTTSPAPAARVTVVRQPVTLVPSADTGREGLWVWPRDAGGPFREFCRTAGERELRGLEAAVCGDRVIVRRAAGRESVPVPMADRGFWPHPRAAGLFLPAGFDLRPNLRSGALARLFGLAPDRLIWVEPCGAGHSVATAAFRPLAGLVEHLAPAAVPLRAELPSADLFDLAPLPALRPDPAGVTPEPVKGESIARPSAAESRPGLLARTFGQVVRRFARPASPPKALPPERKPQPERRPRREPHSPDELVHGPAAVACRRELEGRIVTARGTPVTERWADLGAAYRAAGLADDAALCWLNAAWEGGASREPVERWHEAERRAAGDAVTARVAAATLARPDTPADLPALRAALDAGADDLPVRAAWLAAVGLARASGDVLGLARWRDRLLARLDDRGPALDLDAPSFLRFHGAADPDRFRAARAWLAKARRPVLAWVGRLGKPGRLQWAGLDAETGCTSAYAQMLLAWGLAALGERARAKDWAGRAHKLLTRATAPGADPGVHSVLADALLARIRDAQEGRPPRPGLPPAVLARYDRLPEFARYSVDKFRRFSRVLEPADRVRDYGGREFGGLWGADRLGDRLALLAAAAEPALDAEEVRRLLVEAATDGAGDAVPRVVFTLLELASRLDPAVLPDVLAVVPAAIEGVGRWVGAGRPAAEAAALRPAVLARLVENALTAATLGSRPAAAVPVVDDLVHRITTDSDLRVALGRVAGPVFRSLRTLGRQDESASLLAALDPDRGAWPADAPLPPHRLGLAAGWFAAGDEEAGARLLDDARDRLFVARAGDDRDRTELAVAYAEALGWAPPGLALGRLDELFQRLDGVAVAGSTNRYYTLQPLRLIDRAVRSVVGEDSAPSQAVRSWLADDEFLTRRRIHADAAAALRAAGL